MNPLTTAVTLFSILFPAKAWFAPGQPLVVLVRPQGEIVLVLTDSNGKPIEGKAGATEVGDERQVDLRELFAPVDTPGTYVLWAVPKGKALPDFVGTPLLVSVRPDKRRDAPPGAMVFKVQPLCYAILKTQKGELTLGFYYDVAPNTVDNFVALAAGGFYDGLTFHRIVPGFVIQGGDPRGDGTGGPGYRIDAEFNDREHRPGVLSMAREGDPLERQGAMPRGEAAHSAGSQFFICLDYEKTRQLDRRYTAFARIVDGMSVVEELGKTPVDENDRPTTPLVIESVKILPVTPDHNPYAQIMINAAGAK
ncbi:MAG: peptidylprolyl isomerase [Tepidisphaeraceae bacterium]